MSYDGDFSAVVTSDTSAPVIPTGVFTTVAFTTIAHVVGNGIDVATNPYVDILRGGTFSMTYTIDFATSAVGARGARFLIGVGGGAPPAVVNGNGQMLIAAAPGQNLTRFNGVDGVFPLLAGQTIGVAVFQDSGAPLVMSFASVQVAQIGKRFS